VNEPLGEREPVITLGTSIKLVVEVVSTNWETDYARKVEEYALLGIPEYWIVDYRGLGGVAFIGRPKQPTITVCQLVDEDYVQQQYRLGEPIVSPMLPGLAFKLDNVLPIWGCTINFMSQWWDMVKRKCSIIIYYRQLSEKLDNTLQQHEENWEIIAAELIRLAQNVRAEETETSDNQPSAKIRPFYNTLIDALDSPSEEIKTQIQTLATELVEFINQETQIVGFWNDLALREELRKRIWLKLEDTLLFADEEVDRLADDITQLAERHAWGKRYVEDRVGGRLFVE